MPKGPRGEKRPGDATGVEHEPRRKSAKTKSYNMGLPKFPVDKVAEALAFAEGKDFK